VTDLRVRPKRIDVGIQELLVGVLKLLAAQAAGLTAGRDLDPRPSEEVR
jgi:hypothetical protein